MESVTPSFGFSGVTMPTPSPLTNATAAATGRSPSRQRPTPPSPLNREVIARIERLKELTVTVSWGGHGARKQFRAVRSAGPEDLVFSIPPQGRADARQQHPLPPYQACGTQAGAGFRELAGAATLVRNLAGCGQSGRGGCPSSHAPRPRVDDPGYLPAVCPGVATEGCGAVEHLGRDDAVNRDRIETIGGEPRW
jgi:hypothetical protein